MIFFLLHQTGGHFVLQTLQSHERYRNVANQTVSWRCALALKSTTPRIPQTCSPDVD